MTFSANKQHANGAYLFWTEKIPVTQVLVFLQHFTTTKSIWLWACASHSRWAQEPCCQSEQVLALQNPHDTGRHGQLANMLQLTILYNTKELLLRSETQKQCNCNGTVTNTSKTSSTMDPKYVTPNQSTSDHCANMISVQKIQTTINRFGRVKEQFYKSI